MQNKRDCLLHVINLNFPDVCHPQQLCSILFNKNIDEYTERISHYKYKGE